ncbi:MAG: energy transducer TonB [Sphingomicrobium sp.]
MLLTLAAFQLAPATTSGPPRQPCPPVAKGQLAPPHCEKKATVTLTVGTDGRVKRCRIRKSSGQASIDKAICSLVQARARFKPALDRNGYPVEDEVTPPPITWRVED